VFAHEVGKTLDLVVSLTITSNSVTPGPNADCGTAWSTNMQPAVSMKSGNSDTESMGMMYSSIEGKWMVDMFTSGTTHNLRFNDREWTRDREKLEKH
jgi:hypothetical protein